MFEQSLIIGGGKQVAAYSPHPPLSNASLLPVWQGLGPVDRTPPLDPLTEPTGIDGPIQGHLPLGTCLAAVWALPLNYPQPGNALPGQISPVGPTRPADSLCNDSVEEIEGGLELKPRHST